MRQHGEVRPPEDRSSDDRRRDSAPTRPTRRPKPVGPARNRPNYARRRATVAVAAVAATALGVAAIVGLTRTDDPAVAIPEESLVVSRPAVTAAGPTVVADQVVPVHHGYNSDALYVALYGSIGTGRLGILGEADVEGSIEEAASVAEDYEGFDSTVVPTFEIIASVASFEAGDDGDYSNETPIVQLQPWVDAADEAGYHVVLDLQSGRQRFSSQITEFEELLLEPHVSVALDPEWRVGPNQVPEGGKVGTVTGDEVNATVEYLDRIVAENDLPPKMLIVHQFQDQMISAKQTIRGTDNVQIVIHMDGFGPLRLKRETYARITSDLPSGAVVGWKNFYDEDEPTPTPQETMENDPVPMFVSFQ